MQMHLQLYKVGPSRQPRLPAGHRFIYRVIRMTVHPKMFCFIYTSIKRDGKTKGKPCISRYMLRNSCITLHPNRINNIHALHASDGKYLHKLIINRNIVHVAKFAFINHKDKREIRGKWAVLLVTARRTIPPTEYIKS